MAPETTKVVPLTCHGHSRPVTHLTFSDVTDDEQYYLVSACKDNNPMLRDGTTGDWIGTFIGHKGAVWQARLYADAKFAVTGSADFSAKVWDTHTGQELFHLNHNHIVRSVAFSSKGAPLTLATGGFEKKLRIFDIGRAGNSRSKPTNGNAGSPLSPEAADFQPGSMSSEPTATEIAPGTHTGTIKSIIYARSNPNILLTAADDKYIRWFDLRSRNVISSHQVDGAIGSCELSTGPSAATTTSGGDTSRPLLQPGTLGADGLLSVAAGKSIHLFDGDLSRPGPPLKTLKIPYEAASVAVNVAARRFVTGGGGDTWVRVWDLDAGDTQTGTVDVKEELEIGKGHHGPVWSVAFSPDGKLYATGSEDGTVKLWKFTSGPYGLWR